MKATAEQLDFFLAIFQPLMTVEEVCDILDGVTPPTVAAWLEEGRLLGMDIRHPDAERRAIRVFKYSVEHFLIDPASKPRVILAARLLPLNRQTLRYLEAANFLQCSAEHIATLVKAGCLEGPRFGNRSKRLTVDSFITFVEDRRLDHAHQ